MMTDDLRISEVLEACVAKLPTRRATLPAAKHLVFLLFLKWLGDNPVEAKRVAKWGGLRELADTEAWQSLTNTLDLPRRSTSHALQRVFSEITGQDSEDDGPWGRFDFENDEWFGPSRRREDYWRATYIRLSQLDLRNQHLKTPDAPGLAIARFLDSTAVRQKETAVYYTPREISQLVARLIHLEPNSSLSDPMAGTGNLVGEAVSEWVRHNADDKTGAASLDIYCQDISKDARDLCFMSLAMRGVHKLRVEQGDVFHEPKLVEDSRLMKFDRVVAHIPFGLKLADPASLEDDPYMRFERFGPSTTVWGEFYAVKHVLATLKEDGRAAVIASPSLLSRGRKERDVRQALVKNGLIEAIIELPPKSFSNTTVPGVVVVISMKRPRIHEGRVLMIHGENIQERDLADKLGVDGWQDAAVELFDRYSSNAETAEQLSHDFAGYVAIPAEQDIERNDFDLSVSRYLAPLDLQRSFDLAAERRRLSGLETRYSEVVREMDSLLDELKM